MDSILSLPTQAYTYVDSKYGTVGLIVAGLIIVVAMVGLFIWLDRRR